MTRCIKTYKRIVHNSIRTPDGTVLVSRSVHDYVTHIDKNGHEYMVDGGISYLRRNIVEEAPYEELSLYVDDSHEQIRESVTWGTYGKSGTDVFKLKLIKDLTNDHVNAILKTQLQLSEEIRQMFRDELEFRRKTNTIINEDV